MEFIHQTDVYSIGWYDNKRSILYGHAFGKWTWPEARLFIERLNATVRSVDHAVGTVIHLEGEADAIPRKGNIIANLAAMLSVDDPPNEEWVIYVSRQSTLRNFFGLTGRVHRLTNRMNNYHFANDLDEALQLITDLRATHS